MLLLLLLRVSVKTVLVVALLQVRLLWSLGMGRRTVRGCGTRRFLDHQLATAELPIDTKLHTNRCISINMAKPAVVVVILVVEQTRRQAEQNICAVVEEAPVGSRGDRNLKLRLRPLLLRLLLMLREQLHHRGRREGRPEAPEERGGHRGVP